ncbi:MAG TPA: glycerol-3-phosphate acyltransferase [Armatimonadota bacterium]|nr:glycerol-3-phosphate acyltransferase [Armatimonadota bacterium]
MNDALRALLPILIGYLLGSIPFGYVIVKTMRGIDIREYGSHNIGATNVLRVVGWFPALLTLAGDIGKGVLPPILATLPVFSGPTVNPWLVVLAPLAAIWGHAYSAFFYVKERRFARGKAVAAGAGALIGFVAAGQVAWPALAVVVAVWVGAVALPRLFTGRWGWVSLASILAAVAMPVAFALVRAPLPYVLFGIAAALFVFWKHKENVGRLLDGVEPRLGEKVPLAGVDTDEVSCAFMVHAITPEDWWQTRRFSWAMGLYRARLLPLGVLKRLILLLRPIKSDIIRGIKTPDGRSVQVHIIVVPWLPDQIKTHPKLAVRRAIQAARLAKELGARCFGLGAFWSVVGNKGADVQRAVPEIPVTNGGAYTAGTVKQAVPQVFAKLRARGVEPEQATAAVVGANGVVGFGICRQLAGRVSRLVMVGTDTARLERSAALLRRRLPRDGSAEVVVSTDLAACKGADMIFTATSTVEPVLLPEHVRPEAVIYDLGRPADVHPAVLEIPGVTVIPGGVVRPPGEMHQRLDVHFGPGQIPACMAETILIALDECYDRVSLGDGTHAEHIDHFVEAAQRYGFVVVDEAARPPEPPSLKKVPVPA